MHRCWRPWRSWCSFRLGQKETAGEDPAVGGFGALVALRAHLSSAGAVREPKARKVEAAETHGCQCRRPLCSASRACVGSNVRANCLQGDGTNRVQGDMRWIGWIASALLCLLVACSGAPADGMREMRRVAVVPVSGQTLELARVGQLPFGNRRHKLDVGDW